MPLQDEFGSLKMGGEDLQKQIATLKQQLSIASMGPSIAIDRADVEVGDQIGSGGFSVVYRGTWLGAAVAVKKWFDSHATPEQRTEIREEVLTLAALRHPNVLLFCGADLNGPNSLMVTEHLPCNLSDVLYTMQNVDLRGGKLYSIALDIAHAFRYLHSRKPKVIHRDIKPQNFLLNRAWKVKVCDFGLASCPRPGAGTPHYMAPELLDGSVSYTEKVDVYAFGILVNEMWERRQPFAGKDVDGIKAAVLQGQRPTLSQTMPAALLHLIETCWHQEPQKRPAFENVSDMLLTAQVEAQNGRGPAM